GSQARLQAVAGRWRRGVAPGGDAGAGRHARKVEGAQPRADEHHPFHPGREMTMRTYGLLTLLFAASFAAPARAELAIAECSISNGCSCRMADLTVADFELLTNTTAPDGARDMTLVHAPGSDPYWTSVDRTQVNNHHGGTGPSDLQPYNHHGPEDANWKVTAGQPDLSACPMLKGKMPVGGLMESATRHIEWEGSFHPSRLSDAGPPVDWRKVGRNSWRGTL